MRHTTPTPTGSSLPFPRDRASRRRRRAGSVELTQETAEKFNELVHQLCIEAPEIDADAIASIARWLDSQPPEQRLQLLNSRLERVEELKAMQDDPDWPLDPAQDHRISLMLGYLDREDDLIPDRVPVYGYLDDALLLELAWPIFAEDLEDYRDFCRYRVQVASGIDGPANQENWLRVRSEEGSLWQQLHRVHEQHYIEHRVHLSPFRIK